MTMDAAVYPDEFEVLKPRRMRPVTAFRAFQRLIRDKEDTAQVFEIMRALTGKSDALGYDRLLKTAEGGRQAFLRDELALKLDDPAWLGRFGPGNTDFHIPINNLKRK